MPIKNESLYDILKVQIEFTQKKTTYLLLSLLEKMSESQLSSMLIGYNYRDFLYIQTIDNKGNFTWEEDEHSGNSNVKDLYIEEKFDMITYLINKGIC